MSDSKQIISPPPPGKLEKKPKNQEGKALKGWSIFFFVLTCISTFFVVATTALPFFIIIFGLLMGLIWFIFVVGGSVFTIGLMWTIDGIKSFNAGWIELLGNIFESPKVVAESLSKAIPIIIVFGGVIILITWIFMIVGITTNKNRKKYYTVMMIILGVISLLYIVVTILSIIANANNQVPIEFIFR